MLHTRIKSLVTCGCTIKIVIQCDNGVGDEGSNNIRKRYFDTKNLQKKNVRQKEYDLMAVQVARDKCSWILVGVQF